MDTPKLQPLSSKPMSSNKPAGAATNKTAGAGNSNAVASAARHEQRSMHFDSDNYRDNCYTQSNIFRQTKYSLVRNWSYPKYNNTQYFHDDWQDYQSIDKPYSRDQMPNSSNNRQRFGNYSYHRYSTSNGNRRNSSQPPTEHKSRHGKSPLTSQTTSKSSASRSNIEKRKAKNSKRSELNKSAGRHLNNKSNKVNYLKNNKQLNNKTANSKKRAGKKLNGVNVDIAKTPISDKEQNDNCNEATTAENANDIFLKTAESHSIDTARIGETRVAEIICVTPETKRSPAGNESLSNGNLTSFICTNKSHLTVSNNTEPSSIATNYKESLASDSAITNTPTLASPTKTTVAESVIAFFETPHATDSQRADALKEPTSSSDTRVPRISIIPLSRLIRNELLDLTEDSVEPAITYGAITPSKRICKPNLITRNRKVSTCSNSSASTETLVEKVINMDKLGIQNVINSSGTRYDEALKLQARKRLREEIRKQLKSMNLEPAKDAEHVSLMPDDIVDAIHIPDVVLDEISKAFGIEISNSRRLEAAELAGSIAAPEQNYAKGVRNIAAELYSMEQGEEDPLPCRDNITFEELLNIPLPSDAPQQNQNVKTRISTKEAQSSAEKPCQQVENVSETRAQAQVTQDKEITSLELANATKSNEKSDRSVSDGSSFYVNLSSCSPVSRVAAAAKAVLLAATKNNTSTTPSTERPPMKENQSSSTAKGKSCSPSRAENKASEKPNSPSKGAHSSTPSGDIAKSSRRRRRNSSDVILIESSSSSSASSSSGSSSSSSDTESDSSMNSASSSVRRRRLKLRVDAQNVVDSFEKLILPSLSENLVKRYRTKFSNSTYTKLHFISCICTSEYNSRKFTKIEIAKIQRNLKSEDRMMALEFLLREIVNVFNKQKEEARKRCGNKRRKSSELIKPQAEKRQPEESGQAAHKGDEAAGDGAADNRISAAVLAAVAAIKSKSANAAEKLPDVAAIAERKRKRRKPAQSAPTKHQSANEQTLMKMGVDAAESADSAKKANEIGEPQVRSQHPCNSQEKSNEDNCNKEKPIDMQTNKISVRRKSAAAGESDHKAEHKQQQQQQQQQDKSRTFVTCEAKVVQVESGGCGLTAISSMLAAPYLPTLDLETLKQQSVVGEIVVSNLREIDLQLLDLNKRKMFIEEMILKLQKDKMDVDMQTMKLQNEKFMLLNTAMTAAAVATDLPSSAAVLHAGVIDNKEVSREESTPTSKSGNTPKQSPQTRTPSDKSRRSPRTTTPRDKNRRDCNTSESSSSASANKRRSTTDASAVKRKREMLQNEGVAADKITNSEQGERSAAQQQQTPQESGNVPTAAKSPPELEPANVTEAATDAADYVDLPSASIEGIRSPVTQIRLFENYIIASTEDGNLYKYHIRTLKLEEQFCKHSEAITQMYLCGEKKVLYTTSLDGYLKKTSVENFDLDIQSLYLQEPLQSIDVQWGIAFIGSRWGNIFTYDIATSSLAESLLCSSNSSIIALKATKEGPRKILIVSSKGNFVHFRDASTGLLLRSLSVPENLHIYSILLNYGNLYCGTQRRDIYKFDFTTGAHLSTLTCGNGAVSMRLYKNKFILVGCYDGFIYVLDKTSGQQLGRFPGSGKMVLTLEVAGNKVITAAKDNTLKIIDIPQHIMAKLSM